MAAGTVPYKSSFGGTVGAGMGSLFNGGGRRYYVLEHKVSSKYHRAGETQEIIVDNIEIGRDARCQVRFDESFTTVSRRHAAIVRDGDKWKLIQISHSNSTLLNGQPVKTEWYLQSGDEIQLSINGPKLGFIIPTGKKATVGSIGMTRRLSLFRQQALAPYKRALWTLGCLLLLVVAGFGFWNWKLQQNNQNLIDQYQEQTKRYDSLLDSMKIINENYFALEEKYKNDPENKELKAQIEALKQRRSAIQTRIIQVQDDARQTQNLIKESGIVAPTADEKAAEEHTTADATLTEKTEDADAKAIASTETPNAAASSAEATESENAADDITKYYNDIYTIKVTKITFEIDGKSYDAGIAVSDIVCGTGFVCNGNFITARSNIQPWVYIEYFRDDWRQQLAEYIAYSEGRIKPIIEFEAYSTRGVSHPLRFSSRQFDTQELEANDKISTIVVRKEIRKIIKDWNYTFVKKDEYNAKVFDVKRSPNVAILRGIVSDAGIPTDEVAARNLGGAQEVTIAGFNRVTDIHNLAPSIKYFTSKTSSVAGNNYIVLQEPSRNWGYTGSPAFIKDENGTYKVVGVRVGNFLGEDHIIPINRCK